MCLVVQRSFEAYSTDLQYLLCDHLHVYICRPLVDDKLQHMPGGNDERQLRRLITINMIFNKLTHVGSIVSEEDKCRSCRLCARLLEPHRRQTTAAAAAPCHP